MGLTVHSPLTQFLFIPESEVEKQKEEEKDGRIYTPFSCLLLQLEGDESAAYRARMSDNFEQLQVQEGRGRDIQTVTKTKMNVMAARKLNKDTAKKIVVAFTNFDLPDGTVYPKKNEKGELLEEWCKDEKIICKLIDSMPPEWCTEICDFAQDLSSLKPHEKKS